MKPEHNSVVVIGDGQSARPRACGSCDMFQHRSANYDTFGLCHLQLPPWLSKVYAVVVVPDGVWEVDPRTVRDIDSCDFYRPAVDFSGNLVQFEQRIAWKAGEEDKKGRGPRE